VICPAPVVAVSVPGICVNFGGGYGYRHGRGPCHWR
jgi:hypothetical protein